MNLHFSYFYQFSNGTYGFGAVQSYNVSDNLHGQKLMEFMIKEAKDGLGIQNESTAKIAVISWQTL